MVKAVASSSRLNDVFRRRYKQLRGIVERRLRQASKDASLTPTSFVNSTYLKLAQQRNVPGDDTALFLVAFRAAAERVLGDHLRSIRAKKRPPKHGRLSFDDLPGIPSTRAVSEDVAIGRQVLTRLASVDPVLEEVALYKWGLEWTTRELAEVTGKSVDQVKRLLKKARVLALVALEVEDEDGVP